MFSGIVEATGRVIAVREEQGNKHFTIEAPFTQELRIDQSIAHNGVCLTVTSLDDGGFTADVMHETLGRSSLGALAPGGRVNLERAMPANGRFGGHIVSGHIDGTGKVASVRPDDNALWYTIYAAPELLRCIVEKGSITIDGISLTVAAVDEVSFSVSLIPHTAAVTTLGKKRAGDTVNLETDIIGKYVEKLLRPAPEPERQGGISLEFLAENGF